jgi:cystathionine beta-lyase/cystathionine gamma-synthase
MLEENLAYAERGETAVSFASGMAAISAALGVTVAARQEIIAHKVLYGCTFSLLTNWLPRYGVKTKFCDLTKEHELRENINDYTRVVYFETPANPNLQLIDISAIRRVIDEINSQRCERWRIWIIVDNTFATPFCQRPLDYGADIVVHSLTKDIGGFGTDMGGAVIAPKELHGHLLLYRKDFGGVLSSKNAWMFLVYGLPTLATRMVNQQKTASRVAKFLEGHPKVEKVYYPGLESFPQYELARRQMISYDGKFAPGNMIYFVLKENQEGNNIMGEKLIDYIAERSYTITLAVSLGQIKTLIENPYSMTHAALPVEEKKTKGVDPGGIRLSIGLEDWHDIIDDLREALEVL